MNKLLNSAFEKIEHLFVEYETNIKKAQDFRPTQKEYKELYSQADVLEKRIKTEIVKYMYEVVELQLDEIEQNTREKSSIRSKDA